MTSVSKIKITTSDEMNQDINKFIKPTFNSSGDIIHFNVYVLGSTKKVNAND